MVHGSFRFFSHSLSRMTQIQVILPRPQSLFMQMDLQNTPTKKKCLWFLHGVGDCGEDVLLHTYIGDLADQYNMIVILPDLENSFCLDSDPYMSYETYLLNELIPWTREIFPISDDRADWYLGGISMGGYGALRLGLLHPESWSKIFALSAAVDMSLALRYSRACGINVPQSLRGKPDFSQHPDWDLLGLLDRRQPSGQFFYLDCGKRDMFHKGCLTFVEKAKEHHFSAILQDADGDHDWVYWRERLSPALAWAASESFAAASSV